VVGGDRAEAVQRETRWLTGGAGLSAMRRRERARVRAAGGWGRAAARECARGAGWRARGSRLEVDQEGRGVTSAGRERLWVWAGNWPSQGGRFLFFLIHFLILFLPFFLLLSF
jgi:hypothetical protein